MASERNLVLEVKRILIVLSISSALVLGPATGAWAGLLLSLSNRFITPNADGLNDAAIFKFNNPFYNQVTGKIYDLRGRYVADMSPAPQACSDPNQCQQWDGKANGQAVHTGVYIYVLTTAGATYSGVVVVIR